MSAHWLANRIRPRRTGTAGRSLYRSVIMGGTLESKRNGALQYYLPASVALITFLVYLTALRNDFVNWDDDIYVYENPHIRSLNPAFFKWVFFNFHASYWSPLTWMSHALDYAVWGLNPLGHHLTNNILHAANTFIVVFLVIRLLEAWNERTTHSGPSPFVNERTMLIAAGTTGLLFGLHPVHVESAAWVAERKDLLCALFFLLSITLYAKYADRRQSAVGGQQSEGEGKDGSGQKNFLFNKHYLIALGFFILALLSKPMAVTLPVVLLVLDWYPFNRLRSSRAFRLALIEKLPFFALSLISSMLTVLAANKGGAMELMETVSLSTRVLVGFRSLVAYLGKMIWPLNLVPYYPYPKDASPLSLEYSSAIVLVIGMTAACMVMAKKQKLWLAAWGYYVVTLVPVLGIVQAGGQAMADRFTYLPSLAPFFVMGLAVALASAGIPALGKWRLMVKLFSSILAIVVFASLLSLTFRQIDKWQSSLVLWNYVIEKEPDRFPIAYNNRGLALKKSGRFDEAIADFEKTIALDPSRNKAYNNLGVLYLNAGLFDKSIEYLDKSIAIDPAYAESYNNRGVSYARTGQNERALADFNKAIQLQKDDGTAYYNRGSLYHRAGYKELAVSDFQKACELGIRKACDAMLP